MDRHWLCRATRAPKCVQRPSNDCSSPETYTSSPARMITSNVPWWSTFRGRCRARFIATWRPTGPGISWTFCRPCCALITPHITAPLAWRRAVNWAVAEQVWEHLYSPRRPWCVVGLGSLQLAPSDQVRMSKTRRQFAKGYKGHWSKEIFHVEAVRDTNPVTYVMADAGSEPIKGTFYGPELQKVTLPDYFDVESILDTRRGGNVTEYLVKWAGYPASFNSWERDWSGSVAVPSRASAAPGPDGGAGATRLHKVSRWWVPHWFLTAPWSSPCPAMPASQALYPNNTVTDFRVALPERVALRSNDYEVALASFTYARSWYNVPDLAGQTHTFAFLMGHLHPPPRDGDHAEETATAESEGTAEMPSSHPCEGSTFIKSHRTLSPGYYEHVRQMLHDLNGRGSGSRMGFQFSYHAIRNFVLVASRPGLKNFTGRVTLSRPLSLLLGWPDQETVLMGWGNMRHMGPSQPRRDPVESLFVHCDLAADAHVVDNVRNCLLRAVPAEDRHGQVVCHEPQWLDWLPVRWTEFQHIHVVIMDGQAQKVPFEGGNCTVKLLLRQRGGYFWLWDTSTEALTSSWWPRPSCRSPGLGTSKDMASGVSSKDCSIRPSLCSKALCWGLVCTWPATCSEESPWNRPSRTV